MTRTFFALGALILLAAAASADPLPGTKSLEDKDDLATKMVAGIDTYLMREIDGARKSGADRWKVDITGVDAYLASVKPNRERLAKLLGVVDQRVRPVRLEYVGEDRPTALVAETEAYKVYAVRWPAVSGIDAEGLLLEPAGPATASVVAIPDADQTPEQLVGLAPGIPPESQFARRLAEARCRVLVPVLIDRKPTSSPSPLFKRDTNIPHREFVWRMAYEMGRHIIGYEVQKVLAGVDWLTGWDKPGEVGVYGYGEGGLIALYAGALDPRIKATLASGIEYGSLERVWEEPIDRSVWGALPEFRDEHLRHLFGGRVLSYEQSLPPAFEIANPPGYRQQAAPGRLAMSAEVRAQMEKADRTGPAASVGGGYHKGNQPVRFTWWATTPAGGKFGSVYSYLNSLNVKPDPKSLDAGRDFRKAFEPGARQTRQFNQLVAYTQRLWRLSDDARKKFFAKADFSSPAAWEKSQASYRSYFWEEVIGKLPAPSEPLNPRSREIYDTPKWKGYEVTLDLYPDVFAYGILLLPKDLKPGERRPVVVCQHGLEGRPTDVCNPKERTKYYNSFGAQLADRGYIVYAPQNPYIGWEKFRVLQRKAHPLKLSLFAFIVRQHEVTLDWLSTLPNVDGKKIALYGLSYGGKTAMRVPAILPKYCLSICSGDFNEWVGKNVSIDFHVSYMYTIEYDMYEFDLGHTFNYAEMAYLIAPRPFMVERGHDDGVGIDEMIAYEYAKVRYLYANKLKIPDRTAIEFFPGGHEIHGKGTFAFLKQHLGWPK